MGWTIVLDIGKTLSKATLWNEDGVSVAQRSRPNDRPAVNDCPVLDADGIEKWLHGVLSDFARLGPVTAIVPVAHGAGVALIQRGRLQRPPLDYEWSGVAAGRADYEPQRDPFALTGSPALPSGLNLGMQLHWLETAGALAHDGHLVPWAQYWAWVLSGIQASEVTSLGCHSDLWFPHRCEPSMLAVRRGWAERLAPLTPAHAVLGTLTNRWAEATGLPRATQIHCGLHDSNAALLDARHHRGVKGRDLTVLSTGTWFVAMRLSADAADIAQTLPESRDCLVNVDHLGNVVPSARFMGGREIELLVGHQDTRNAHRSAESSRQAVIESIDKGRMILPSLVPGVGPYPRAQKSPGVAPDAGDAAGSAHVYAALLADASLDLIGSHDTLLIEGRFSASPIFTQTLAALRPTMRVLVSHDDNGVARGALRLAGISTATPLELSQVQPLPVEIADYRRRWREAAAIGA